MKRNIIICCLVALLLYTLHSCVSFLPPSSTISTLHFSLVSPDEERWSESTDCETGKEESICLEKGTRGSSSSMFFDRAPEYPIQKFLVIRNRIRITTSDKEKLLVTINEVVRDEMLKVLNKYDSTYSFLSNNENEKDYYRFCWRKPSSPDKYWHYHAGGIGEYYIYLPQYYNKYQCYYLFQYKITDNWWTEDKFTPQYISDGLIKLVKYFRCIEDSIDMD